MPDKQVPPAPSGSANDRLQGPVFEWTGTAPTPATYVDLTTRLARADLKLCEMQASMDELVDANCRLRSELGEMTLQWVIEKTKD